MLSFPAGRSASRNQVVNHRHILCRVLVLFTALSASAVLLSPSRAAAHTGFESSDPADGSSVVEAIGEVTITFSGVAEPTGEGFVVMDPSGTVRPPDSLSSDAAKQVWTLRFEPPLAEGVVGVRWTVQAPDAHPISGGFSFSVGPVPQSSFTAGTARDGTAVDGSTDAIGGSADPAQSTPTVIASESVRLDGLQSEGTRDGSQRNTQDLQAFLQHGEQSVSYSVGVGVVGRVLELMGTMLAIGGLCFGTLVVGNDHGARRPVLRVARWAALGVIVGAGINLSAHMAIVAGGWSEMFSVAIVEAATLSTFGLAIGLRAWAGSLLLATITMPQLPVERFVGRPVHRELVPAGDSRLVVLGDPLRAPATAKIGDEWPGDLWSADEPWRHDLEPSRPVMVARSVDESSATAPAHRGTAPVASPASVAVVGLLASFAFDGHTATEGHRLVTAAVDMVHVAAAAVWAGGVVSFTVVLWRRYRQRVPLDVVAVALRFSVIAAAALAVAGLAGLILAAIILDSASLLWATSWGRLLLAKTAVVAVAAGIGGYNHFIVIPSMSGGGGDRRSPRLRNTVTGEALLLATVLVITAFLVGASSVPS